MTNKSLYIKEIDALRGLAAIVIILSFTFLPFASGGINVCNKRINYLYSFKRFKCFNLSFLLQIDPVISDIYNNDFNFHNVLIIW